MDIMLTKRHGQMNPVVHIFPHWNWPGKEGDSIKVHCYTNCEEVELFLNGKSIGRQKAVPYTKLDLGT